MDPSSLHYAVTSETQSAEVIEYLLEENRILKQ